MAIREGRWDCRHCGTRGVRGHLTACPECGAARDVDVEFYLPEDEPEVTDSERLTEAEAGPDWHCEHCGGDNPGSAAACLRCGAARGASAARDETFYAGDAGLPHTGEDAREIVSETHAEREAEAQERAGAGVPGYAQAGYYQSPAESTTRSALKRAREILTNPVTIMLTAFAAIGWAIWFFLVATHPATMTVSQVSWRRSISVEHYITVSEEDWAVPTGGRVAGSGPRIHHYDQVFVRNDTRTRQVSERVQTGTRHERVKVGTRSKGNGYFEDVYEDRSEPIYETRYHTETYTEPVYKDVPVYRTFYRYNIERWKPARDVTAQKADHEPLWPDPQLRSNERESGRREEYRVRITGPRGKTFDRTISEGVWDRCNIGQRVTAHLNRAGAMLRIDLPGAGGGS